LQAGEIKKKKGVFFPEVRWETTYLGGEEERKKMARWGRHGGRALNLRRERKM